MGNMPEYVIIHYGKDKDGKTWKKVVGRFTDKDKARTVGKEEADKIVYRGEWVSMLSGKITEDGDPIGQFRFFDRWE